MGEYSRIVKTSRENQYVGLLEASLVIPCQACQLNSIVWRFRRKRPEEVSSKKSYLRKMEYGNVSKTKPVF